MEENLSVVELLISASGQIIPVPEREPWEYGWAYSEYRNSDRAALNGREGPVTLSSAGITALEKAVTILLKEKRIRDRWNPNEIWGMAASAVVIASGKEKYGKFLDNWAEVMRTVGPALTVHLISNVTWGRSPILIGDAVLGDADKAFLDFVNVSAGKRSKVSAEHADKWLEKEVRPRVIQGSSALPAAISCWTVSQERTARKESERQLHNIVNLVILLERDLPSHRVYHRGNTNRPGVRGIVLDRGAIERGIIDAARLELASAPLNISPLGISEGLSWFNAEPLPLGTLLDQKYLYDGVKSCLQTDPISSRIKVAARWFTEAHYTLEHDDAALALGVAMDALLSGQRALPGSAMADRFALLEPDPKRRRELVTNYLELYKVRSSVAHGGRSSKLDETDFIDNYRAAVHWAAWRSLALRDEFKVSSEKEVDALCDDLRLGVRSWAMSDNVAPEMTPQVKSVPRPHRQPAPRRI